MSLFLFNIRKNQYLYLPYFDNKIITPHYICIKICLIEVLLIKKNLFIKFINYFCKTKFVSKVGHACEKEKSVAH